MFNLGIVTFQEFLMKESLPLSALHEAVMDFIRGRSDAVLFGAHAVNAYVPEPRMSQDVDLLSTRAADLAEELRVFLSQKFHIAVQVREVADARGYRLYQLRKEGNRHLADLRQIDELPQTQEIDQITVLTPVELIAYKVISYHQRRGQPKSGTDWRDVTMLLLTFPHLKNDPQPVLERLRHAGADLAILETWRQLAAQNITFTNEEEF